MSEITISLRKFFLEKHSTEKRFRTLQICKQMNIDRALVNDFFAFHDRHVSDSQTEVDYAKQVVDRYRGRIFTVTDVVPSELLWALDKLKRFGYKDYIKSKPPIKQLASCS